MGLMMARRRQEANAQARMQKAEANEKRQAEMQASLKKEEIDDGAKLEGTKQNSSTSGLRGKNPSSRKRDLQQDSE